LLRNTAYNSEWLTRPELVEIKVSNVQTASRGQKRLFEFSMRVTIKRPQDANPEAAIPAANAGSAPAAKKS
jgi:type IV pilus assembly protein PilN